MQRSRPDLKLLAIAVAQSDLDAKVARATRLPDPDLGVTLDVRDPGDTLVGASLALPIPLFDRKQGDIAAADRKLEAARALQAASVADAQREVETLCAEIETGERLLAHIDARISPLAKRQRDSLIAAFRLGEVPLEDTIFAARELLDIEQVTLDATYRHSAARLALEAAVGTP